MLFSAVPFPLAHPAAVLPLKRCCPRPLSFSALVIGSLSPDFGYCFGPLKIEDFSHSALGTVCFCLPIGLVALWAFQHLGGGSLRANPKTATVEPLRLTLPPVLAWAAVSLLVGAWTHLLWDGFTHKEGWFVTHIPVLRMPLTTFMGRTVRVFSVLWYLCSFAGVGVLYVAYEGWKEGRQTGARLNLSLPTVLRAGTVAGLAVLLATIHHIARHSLVVYAAGLLSVVLVLGLGYGLGLVSRAR